MHQSVVDALLPFNKPLEGCVAWPYQDILGLVTVGIGCLIEPVDLALPLKWEGNPSAAVIRAEWARVNALPKGMHFNRYRAASTLRLTEAGIVGLLTQRALGFEVVLRKYFPEWDDWPADAQLAVMAMAWACGPGFPKKFLNFARYALDRDWINAAKCAGIKTAGNPGIVPRNAQVQLCLANAAAIDNPGGYATPALYWPGPVLDEAKPNPEDMDHYPLVALARNALETFSINDCGLTGHCHDLAA